MASFGAAGNLRRNPSAAWRHLDLVLIGCVTAVSLLGALMVYTATRGPAAPYDSTFALRQLFFVAIGLVLMAALTVVDYRVFRDYAFVIYGGACALLLLVVSPIGSSSKGSQAWFQMGSFQLQPSEFAKLGLICGLAAVGSQFRSDIDARRLVALLALAVLPMVLIMFQPDLGTALIVVMLTAGVLLVAGAPARYLLALSVVTVVGVFGILRSDVLADYQKLRLTSFLSQDEALSGNQELARARYNTDQSKTAIGNGGPFGQGIFDGSQTRLANVPEQHTDFIFTAVGEQLGFAGSATLLAMFSILAWRIWRTAQLARDPFGMLVCVGVLCMFMFQIFENVGMTMGIMPVTGIPLPFVSYGGSSTLAYFMAIGLVLNVHMRRFS
ncbi:MAG: rod shape-determining protein RodA [Acidimicrobiia bacterium]